MIVTDSSYLIEGLLKDASLLEEDEIITPELALYEGSNTIWNHETILRFKQLPRQRPNSKRGSVKIHARHQLKVDW